MQIKFFILGIVFALAVSARGELRAQIMFEDIRPDPTVGRDITPKGIHMAPLSPMAVPSKPSAPMPHFKQHVIAPDRIQKTFIQKDNLRPERIQMNEITFNPMVKTDIKPREIRMNTLVESISPGRDLAPPPPIEKTHWIFNPTFQGDARPSIRFSSTIKAPRFDYNSPYHKDIPPQTLMHPMAW